MRFILTQEERELIATRRAFLEYNAVRLAPDPTLVKDEDEGEDRVYIELNADLSGRMMVEPDGPCPKTFQVCSWPWIREAAAKISEARSAIELAREERNRLRQVRKTGDPRRGRKQHREGT